MKRRQRPGPKPNADKGGQLIGTYLKEDQLLEIAALCVRHNLTRTDFIKQAVTNEIKRYRALN